MAKPPVAELEPLSPQRATLAKAITNRQQAQADHDAAETGLSEAEAAKWPVLAAISEAENMLAQAKRLGDPDRIAVCEDELRHAQMHELPARAAVVTAKDKVAVAADHLDDVARLVRPAVDAVIRSELSPIAATILADFQAAQAAMIAAGTAIQTLHERDLCAIEGLKAAYSTLFTNPARWPGFRERAQVHPLRSMVAALSQDALALVVIAH